MRLIKGDFKNQTEYKISPLDQAGLFKDNGFKNLHIVDLDGALTGKTINLNIIKNIVSKYNFKVEIGGGVRTLKTISKYLDMGADKVILGSAAIKNSKFLKEACKKFKNKIALSLDAKNEKLAISGWQKDLNIKISDFLKEVNNFGISRIIYTDINRDGTKMGPNLEVTNKIAKISKCPIIISGGVSSVSDIRKVKKHRDKNVHGIIIGKAIYDGDIKLDELAKEMTI